MMLLGAYLEQASFDSWDVAAAGLMCPCLKKHLWIDMDWEITERSSPETIDFTMNILGAFRFQCSDRLGGLHYCGYAINATSHDWEW